MSGARLLRDQVETLYREYECVLRRFLCGVLRDADLAEEAVQQTFVKVMEHGHEAGASTLKGWIFRVAFHEALQIRRRRALHAGALARIVPAPGSVDPARHAHDREALEQVRAAMLELPAPQQEVLRMRIQQGRTFAAIARDLGIPLGTALTRMRLALERLRGAMRADCVEEDRS